MGTRTFGVHGVRQSQNKDGEISCFVDSDWAGCKTTRKSTSGGALFVGGTLVQAWSKTQNIVAQSSAEAEFYSIHHGLVESLFVQSLASEIGLVLLVSGASDGTATRSGESETLADQESVCSGRGLQWQGSHSQSPGFAEL